MKFSRYYRIAFSLALLFSSTLVGLISLFPGTALAATGEWVDIATIRVGDVNYIDSDPYDNNLNYKEGGNQGDCVSEVKGFSTSRVEETNNVGSATLYTKTKDPVTGSCSEITDSITLSNVNNSRNEFRWIDQGTLQYIAEGEVFTRIEGQNIFVPDTNQDCKVLSVEVINDTTASLIFRTPFNGCQISEQRDNLVITNDTGGLDILPGQGAANGGVAGVAEDSCEGAADFAFNFILCPVLYAGDKMLSFLDDKIISSLSIENDYYDNPEIRRAWSNIRNIAYILLIPTMLLMVIGTALGFNFLDAYTVKRAMPRLVAAVIFIALSYSVCVFLIELTETFGRGIGGIIASPWGGTGALTLDRIFDPGAGSIAIGGIIVASFLARNTAVGQGAIGAATSAISSVSFIVLAITVGLAALTLLIIFTLLAFREMAIIFLILMSPLAIIAWIFPGNDKPWKFWWGTFSKLLMLFPLIVAALTFGRVFAVMVGDAGNSDPVVGTIIKLAAVVGPYFLIPAMFKWVGGAFGNVVGMVNDRSRGIYDRGRKKRAETMKHNKENFREGQRFKGDSAFAQRMNARGRRYNAMHQANKEGGFRAAFNQDRIDTIEESHANEHAQKGSELAAFTDIAGDDAKNSAAFYTTRADIERELIRFDPNRFTNDEAGRHQAVEQIMRAQRVFGDNEAFQRARLDAQGKTGTSYQNEDGEFNADLAIEDINRVYGADRSGAGRALARMRSNLTQSGQIAGQAGYGTWASQMEAGYRADADLAEGRITQQQRAEISQSAHDTIMENAFDSVPPDHAIYGKPSSARAFASSQARRIQRLQHSISTGEQIEIRDDNGNVTGTRQATQTDLDAALAYTRNVYEAMGRASPQNASAAREELMRVRVEGAAPVMEEVQKTTADGKPVMKQIEIADSSGTVIETKWVPDTEMKVKEYVMDDGTKTSAPTILQMTEDPKVRGSETTKHTRYDWAAGQITDEQLRNRDNPGGPPAAPGAGGP